MKYFGGFIPSPTNYRVRHVACHDAHPNLTSPSWLAQTYVWGRYSCLDSTFDYLPVWECNYTRIDIKTKVTLLGSEGDRDILIDHNNPPVQHESSIQLWTPPFSVLILDEVQLDEMMLEIDPYDQFEESSPYY